MVFGQPYAVLGIQTRVSCLCLSAVLSLVPAASFVLFAFWATLAVLKYYSRFYTQKSHLTGLWELYGILEIKPGLAECKASSLPTVL